MPVTRYLTLDCMYMNFFQNDLSHPKKICMHGDIFVYYVFMHLDLHFFFPLFRSTPQTLTTMETMYSTFPSGLPMSFLPNTSQLTRQAGPSD